MSLLSALQAILGSVGSHVSVVSWLELFALVFGRVAPAVALAPFLGGSSVSTQIKTGLGVIISVVLLPVLPHVSADVPQSMTVFIALLLKEVAIGSMIGFLAQLVFYAVQISGIVIDTQRGLNQITYLAPQLPGHVSALGSLQFQASLVVFLALRGHLLFIRALGESFRELPLLEIPHFSKGVMPVAELAAQTTGDALLFGVQLAAPVVLAIFLTDVAFASLGKAASRLRLLNEAYTAKAMVGLAVLFFGTAFVFDQLPPAFAAMLKNIKTFLEAMT
jgi:flagellar biosynthesis protein FliR